MRLASWMRQEACNWIKVAPLQDAKKKRMPACTVGEEDSGSRGKSVKEIMWLELKPVKFPSSSSSGGGGGGGSIV